MIKIGYKEAKEDGIKIVHNGLYSEFRNYVLKCNSCGCEVISSRYERGKVIICNSCKENSKNIIRMARKNNMMELAANKIRKMTKYIPDNELEMYEEAIAVMENDIFNKYKFDSSEEVLVAIELIKNNIPFKHHEKIAGYEVDFFLPDEKIILEIDGIIYHNMRVDMDKIRDDNIIGFLGQDYRVVRILDKSINNTVLNLMCIIEEYLTSGLARNNYLDDNWYYIISLQKNLF